MQMRSGILHHKIPSALIFRIFGPLVRGDFQGGYSNGFNGDDPEPSTIKCRANQKITVLERVGFFFRIPVGDVEVISSWLTVVLQWFSRRLHLNPEGPLTVGSHKIELGFVEWQTYMKP